MKPPTDKALRAGWKKHLLQSGIPLEFQVAQFLASAGFSINADFSFFRGDGADRKEFSIDFVADWLGGGRGGDFKFNLKLLVECKYRSPNKVVILLPEPNTEYSPTTLGGTVNDFDFHIPYFLKPDGFVDLDKEYEFAYKAIELFDAGAIEQDFRHGIYQLRYAMPYLLRREIDFQFGSMPEDRYPFFILKILVTNSPLRILDSECSIANIERAKDISEISTSVGSAIIYSDYGPDYERHFEEIFTLNSESRLERALRVRNELVDVGKRFSRLDDPVNVVRAFAGADRFSCQMISNQFVISNFSSLPKLIASVKKLCRSSYSGRNKGRNGAGDDVHEFSKATLARAIRQSA